MNSTVLCRGISSSNQIAIPRKAVVPMPTSPPSLRTSAVPAPAQSPAIDTGAVLFPNEMRRRLILNLSQVLLRTSCRRRELSSIMFEALHYGLEQLFQADASIDLQILEEWLQKELEHEHEVTLQQLLPDEFMFNESTVSRADTGQKDLVADQDVANREPAVEKAVLQERRFCERRFCERRFQDIEHQSGVQDSCWIQEDRRHLVDRRCGQERRKSLQRHEDCVEPEDVSRCDHGLGAWSTLGHFQDTPDKVAEAISHLRGAAASAVLNSALFGSQSVPLSNSYFLRLHQEQAAQEIVSSASPVQTNVKCENCSNDELLSQ